MVFGLVLAAARAHLAVIDVMAPAAVCEAVLFAHHPTDRTRFEHFSHNMARDGPPGLQRLMLFPYSCQIVVAEHKSIRSPRNIDANSLASVTRAALYLPTRFLTGSCKDCREKVAGRFLESSEAVWTRFASPWSIFGSP